MSDVKKELFYKEFVQREDILFRAPYHDEQEFFFAIKAGDTTKVKELCKESLLAKTGLGTLSKNPLQNIKYHFTITTAMVARYCIEGGMEMAEAYSLSDFYISKADEMTQATGISDLHPIMCQDYAKRMKNLRKNKVCSLHVANCLDYIYDHLHTRITVQELANRLNINASYLSRLFKKEVGTSISDYILSKKIETARNMLIYSTYTSAEIATILAFPSQSYFTEVFRKKSGLTPVKYRAEHFRNINI